MNHLATTEGAQPPTQCVILAGGRGSRLGHLTADLPKPLMPVAGQPFLDHLIDRCVRFGFSEVLVLAGYKAEALEAWERRRRAEPPQITVLREDGPRGTAGAIVAAADALQNRFMVLNGDSLTDINWLAFAVAAGRRGEAWMAVRPTQDLARYGEVVLQDGRITAFREKSAAGGSGLMNCGIYVLHKSVLTDMAGDFSLETETFPRLAAAGRLFGAAQDGAFVDIGVPESLAWADAHVGAWGPQGLALVDGTAVAVALATDDAKSAALLAALKLMADQLISIYALVAPGSTTSGAWPEIAAQARACGIPLQLVTARDAAALADANALTHLGVDRRHMWLTATLSPAAYGAHFQRHDVAHLAPSRVRAAFDLAEHAPTN